MSEKDRGVHSIRGPKSSDLCPKPKHQIESCMRTFARTIIYICFLVRSFNGEWYWQCGEGNDEDLIATVRAENLVQALASFLAQVAQQISDPRMGSNTTSSASGSEGLGSDGFWMSLALPIVCADPARPEHITHSQTANPKDVFWHIISAGFFGTAKKRKLTYFDVFWRILTD